MIKKPFPLPLLGHPRATLKDLLKLALGAVVFPVQTRRWRAFLRANRAVGDLACRYPRVLHKIYRPYLSRKLRCTDRVDVMMAHYRHVVRHGLEKLVCRAAARPVALAQFDGKEGSRFLLQLAAANVGHREGEMTLQLMHEARCIYAASFALALHDGESWIQLGALQGMRAADGAQAIKQATRALHGWRPKQMMVALVRELGDYFGCATMRMVSNDNRVTINWRRHRRISSDYDAAWQELRAVRRGDGDYEVPCILAPAPLASVPSHKRAETRRRQELLAAVGCAMRGSLDARRSPPEPQRRPAVVAPTPRPGMSYPSTAPFLVTHGESIALPGN